MDVEYVDVEATYNEDGTVGFSNDFDLNNNEVYDFDNHYKIIDRFLVGNRLQVYKKDNVIDRVLVNTDELLVEYLNALPVPCSTKTDFFDDSNGKGVFFRGNSIKYVINEDGTYSTFYDIARVYGVYKPSEVECFYDIHSVITRKFYSLIAVYSFDVSR